MGESTRVMARRPARRVDRRTAQVAEENFFERLAAAIAAARCVQNPLDGRTLEISPSTRTLRTLDHRVDALKDMIKRLVDRDLLKTYDEMPKSQAVLHEVAGRELPGLRRVRVAVAGVALSPVEELLRHGSSSQPITAADLAKARDEIVVRPDLFYFLCAFATTSWDPAAADTLSGGNYLIALADFEEDAWRVRFAPDARWGVSARLFDLTTYEEKLDAIRRFADRHLFELLMDEMTEDYVFEHFGYSTDIIRDAFEWIERETEFVKYDATSTPGRLVRMYT